MPPNFVPSKATPRTLSFCDFAADSPNAFAELSPSLSLRSAPTSRWWTGEDSNLRSPQGAADLQSAGFSHSPTRPANSFGTRVHVPEKSSGHNSVVPRKQPEHDRTAVRGTSQCRKGSCRKTPALALLSRGIRPQPCQKSLSLKTQLAEGVEPPTL
jgi:hypothetical protein